jgi:hypothetical protein
MMPEILQARFGRREISRSCSRQKDEIAGCDVGHAAVVEDEAGVRAGVDERGAVGELARQQAKIKGEPRFADARHVFTEQRRGGEFVRLGVQHAAVADEKRVGGGFEMRGEIHMFRTAGGDDTGDAVGRVLGK